MNGLSQVLISAHGFNVSRNILLQASKETDIGVNTVYFFIIGSNGEETALTLRMYNLTI
jgi:hypothetical protein